ncbi:MAG: hypothetical protein ACOYH4_05445 [Saccharofermentanales bacterium]|jgi:ABC-type transport system involved in multi-copper enzyme maturation permease subunit
MTHTTVTDVRPRDRGRSPGIGRVVRSTLARSRSIFWMILCIFLLAMPVVLLIIGGDNYAAITRQEGYASFLYAEDAMAPVFVPIHLVNSALASLAAVILAAAPFATIYRRDAVDVEFSLPLTRTDQIAGRLIACIAQFFGLFAITLAVTGIIMGLWHQSADFWTYARVYGTLFVRMLELMTFTVCIMTCSGTMLDGLLTLALGSGAWFAIVYGIGEMFVSDVQPHQALVSFFSPGANLITGIQTPNFSLVWYACKAILWAGLAWLIFHKRPAEWAGVRHGRLPWFPWIQPLFAAFGAVTFGLFLNGLIPAGGDITGTDINPPVLVIGMICGALMGQFISSAIWGEPILADRGPDGARKRSNASSVTWHILRAFLGFVLMGAVALILWLTAVK